MAMMANEGMIWLIFISVTNLAKGAFKRAFLLISSVIFNYIRNVKHLKSRNKRFLKYVINCW